MGVEEDIQQLVIADLRGIVGHANHFGVPRASVTDLLVVGSFLRASGVAAGHVGHSLKLLERRLGAPEAATGKYRGFRLPPRATTLTRNFGQRRQLVAGG